MFSRYIYMILGEINRVQCKFDELRSRRLISICENDLPYYPFVDVIIEAYIREKVKYLNPPIRCNFTFLIALVWNIFIIILSRVSTL